MSPREAWDLGQQQTGYRERRQIAVNREFSILTLPTTRKGKAKVQAQRGVKIGGLWYWAEALKRHDKKSVRVKYDPFDVTHAYAHLDGEWVELDAAPEIQRFRPLSERALAVITSELRRTGQIGRASAPSVALVVRALTRKLPAKAEAQILADSAVLGVTARLAETYPSLAMAGPTTHLRLLEPPEKAPSTPALPLAGPLPAPETTTLPRFGSF